MNRERRIEIGLVHLGCLSNYLHRGQLYRRGRGWVVDVWDEFCNAWRVGSERDYWQARQLAGQRMLEAAMREMGIEDDGVYNVSSQFVSDRGRCNNCGCWTDYVPR